MPKLMLVKTGGRPVFQLHTQGQTVSGQHFLNFIQGLAAQVRGLEQFIFSALNQVTDVEDLFALQAIGERSLHAGEHLHVELRG